MLYNTVYALARAAWAGARAAALMTLLCLSQQRPITIILTRMLCLSCCACHAVRCASASTCLYMSAQEPQCCIPILIL